MTATPTGRTEGTATDGIPDTVPLKAGPLSMLLRDGDLRRIRWGGREVIRRIHGAVRDRNWGTIPGTISDLHITGNDASFRISYTREHRQDEIDFVWRAEIVGTGDGTIRFTFDGEARSTFLRNRIGLCVLHPLRECAGAPCRTRHADGSTHGRKFPDLVAIEQPMAGFTDLTGLSHEIAPGVWMDAFLEGDLFETEDQRNWIDASFKTYSTPLRLPFPAEITAGTRIRQGVEFRLRFTEVASLTEPPDRTRAPSAALRIHPGAPVPVPELGLGMASHGRRLDHREIEQLSRLGPAHLRVDLSLDRPDWTERLRTAAVDSAELGTALELVVHLPRHGPGDLGGLARGLTRLRVDLVRVLILRDGQRSTLPEDLVSARAALADCGAMIGAGTDSDLYQLHLQPPPDDGDFLQWSMNPQVHASDDLSILETPEAIAHQLATLRRRHPTLPLFVSPITLKPRHNPVATRTEVSGDPTGIPPQVDVRQSSLLTAAWTLAVFKALAEGGAAGATFFETTGWRGVIGTPDGSPLPESFRSVPGSVFPVYHVLADIGEFSRGEVVPTATDDPQNLAPLLLRHGTRRRWILANLSEEPRRISLEDVPGSARLRQLDDTSLPLAMGNPTQFRSRWETPGARTLSLPPRGLVTLDFTAD